MSDTEFESFVMNAGPDILMFCRIITNNKEQGDELYQDAMVLLLEKRASLKAEQNSKSHALSVAVLLWKNKKKKYANRMRIAPVSSLEEHQETASSEETSGQDHDNRYYHRLWNKPHGFLLSFQGYL